MPLLAKNRLFIKEVEAKKRREKEARARHERRKKKRHAKRTRELLEEAAARQEEVGAMPRTERVVDNEPVQAVKEDKVAHRKEQAKRQKELLERHRAYLALMQAKQSEEVERDQVARDREARKWAKVTQRVLQTLQDHKQRVDSTKQLDGCQAGRTKVGGTAVVGQERVQTDDEKQRGKEQREALYRKQQQYLQTLVEQRKQKEKDDKDAGVVKEKQRRWVQKQAQLRLHDAAQALADAREKEEAAALAAEQQKAVGPTVDVDAMVARLSQVTERETHLVPAARDFGAWKKRHNVGRDQKVFSITGWYPVIRDELEKRGWVLNPDRTSPYFDLKWTLKSDDLRLGKLEKWQYVNHFFQNAAITTKVGLLHSLRSAIWHQSVDIDAFFPRAYDLNDAKDMDTFIQDFRSGVAEGLLKQLARWGLQRKEQGSQAGVVEVNEAVLDVVFDIARKQIKRKRPASTNSESPETADLLEESVDDPLSSGVEELVTDLQWEVLTACPVDKPGRLRASLVYTKKRWDEEKADLDPSVGVDASISAQEKRAQRYVERMHADAFVREKSRLNHLLARVSPVRVEVFDVAIRLAQDLEKLCFQFHINGGAEFMGSTPPPDAGTSTSHNVWIVKPAGMSRGRGIRIFNDLTQLLDYVDVANHKECQWVAQKYIENPLLICKRKFDIRQWVLVTGWDPLTIWYHSDCYLRFSSEEYSMADLSDQYVHLTNNSIQKHSDKFTDVYATEDGAMQVEGNMWHSDALKAFLATKTGTSASWDAQLHPRMKAIVIQSLECVQDRVHHRRNTCELYGYDFMIDAELNPWLIEVNSSPACDYSTPTAQRYVESGLAGIIKVVVDYREYERTKRHGTGTRSEAPDTGCWQRIHKADYIGKPTSALAVDFHVKGSQMHRRRRGNKVYDDDQDCRTEVAIPILSERRSSRAYSESEVASEASVEEIDPLL